MTLDVGVALCAGGLTLRGANGRHIVFEEARSVLPWQWPRMNRRRRGSPVYKIAEERGVPLLVSSRRSYCILASAKVNQWLPRGSTRAAQIVPRSYSKRVHQEPSDEEDNSFDLSTSCTVNSCHV